MEEGSVKPQIYFSYTDPTGYTVSANMDVVTDTNSHILEEMYYCFNRFLLLSGFDQQSIDKYMSGS